MHRQPRPSRTIAALCGLVVAAVALAVAEFVSSLEQVWRSPMLDVGDRVIDAAPPFVKEFAIEAFGANDKKALLIGMAGLIAVAAVALGLAALRHRLIYGVAGLAAFGVIGSWAAASRRAGAPWHVFVPSVAGALAGIGALVLLHHATTNRRATPAADTAAPEVAGGADRREFLLHTGGLLAGLAATAVVLGSSGRWLRARFSAAASRAAVVLPRPARPLDALPATVELGVPGVTPFVTSNAAFYRVDTALAVPQLTTDDYRLKVGGMVERELRLTYDELLRRPMVERDITMTCVSNEIGGTLVGNARWLGTRLDDLLREAGIRPGADQIVGRSVDGYTCGFPVSVATDGRDALVVVGMNGEPLPLEHGFPVRLVVPGLYGYVSATKWLTEIEVTTFAAVDHYWSQRGWATEAPIKLMSRIDTPRGLSTVPAGTVPIAGVAWAQHVGIGAVEVQIDDGPWTPATLARAPSADTWVQWMLPWEASPGRHSVRVRAIDAKGAIQTAVRAEPIPDGASGHHQIVVSVA